MTDRDDFERRAVEAASRASWEALRRQGKTPVDEAWGDLLEEDREQWRAEEAEALLPVLDALGLRAETAWTDNGTARGNLSIHGDGLHLDNRVGLATDEELRAVGMIKKRRLVSDWEVLDD